MTSSPNCAIDDSSGDTEEQRSNKDEGHDDDGREDGTEDARPPDVLRCHALHASSLGTSTVGSAACRLAPRWRFVQSATLTTFMVATNDYRSAGNERTEYHACVAWGPPVPRSAGQFLSKDQLVDVEGRLRQWNDDAGKRHCKVGCYVGLPPADRTVT